jgi:hypothetical protein
MMRKINGNYIGHNLNDIKFPKSSDFICTTYATWKLILRPSPIKINTKPLKFLEIIQDDICGLIQPLPESLRYFIVLINTST